MRELEELGRALTRIDGRGYRSYRELAGSWVAPWHGSLELDHVQADPFASPSQVVVHVHPDAAGIPPHLMSTPPRQLACATWIAARFADAARSASRSVGTGHGGLIRMVHPGQYVLRQTALGLSAEGGIEARFTVGLPAQGRRVMGKAAEALLCEVIPKLVDENLLGPSMDLEALADAADLNEDAEFIRSRLMELGLIAWIGDGSHLPRETGRVDTPLKAELVTPFQSPESLRVAIDTPNSGLKTGMGIPRGVTIVAGGGFHGKSTLLRAIQRGVYNRRLGDGREWVITRSSCVAIRAEDGRPVTAVDISSFIGTLPGGIGTKPFTTRNASGSTSQAAAVIEAVEAGASALLIDEDTAATNFMTRDQRMRALVPDPLEPITPLLDRIRGLYEEWGVSTLAVLGSSGDFLPHADTVLVMRDYQPHDATSRARDVVDTYPNPRPASLLTPLERPDARRPLPSSIDPRKGKKAIFLRTGGIGRLGSVGVHTLDLRPLQQVVSPAQLDAILLGIVQAGTRMDGSASLVEVVSGLVESVSDQGLDSLAPYRRGDLAEFRVVDLVAAINRLPTLRLAPPG